MPELPFSNSNTSPRIVTDSELVTRTLYKQIYCWGHFESSPRPLTTFEYQVGDIIRIAKNTYWGVTAIIPDPFDANIRIVVFNMINPDHNTFCDTQDNF